MSDPVNYRQPATAPRDAAQRAAGPDLPDDAAATLIERGDEPEAVGREDLAVVVGEAASEQ